MQTVHWKMKGAQITAALHGFEGVDDYYRRSSSRQYLKQIRRHTLIIHSLDDPFMFTDTVPDESELSEHVALELARNGGHLGFISGRILPRRWLEQRIIDYLKSMTETIMQDAVRHEPHQSRSHRCGYFVASSYALPTIRAKI